MSKEWSDFLSSHPVGSDPAPDCALCDLSHLGLIRVRGEDATTFLQGQLTSDVRLVTDERAQPSAWCSPKGRMLASFLVFRHAGDVYLQTPRERVAALLKRLRMFVLRAKVELADASDELARAGIAGGCAAELLAGAAPEEPFAVRQDGGVTLIRLPGDRARVEIVGTAAAVKALWERAAPTGGVAGPDFWALLDIRAGLPTVYDGTAEAFVPQMANLQLVEGVSFTKGCYTGQEVVARMQYLGKLKRRMYLARVATGTVPQPGDDLYAPGSESGQGAGKVVDARRSPAGDVEALVVVEAGSAAGGEVRIGGPKGPRLAFSPLPYPLPED
jgi:hypothetical protein